MGKKPATYADLEALPEGIVGELVAGKLYASPRPAFPHAIAASHLSSELTGPFDRGRGGPGGWLILNEPELHVGDDVLVPDIAGWRRERLPETPRGSASRVAPDWVCEVLSPSTRKLDREVKLPVYAREGVHHVWFLDPVPRVLEVFRLQPEGYKRVGLHSGTAVIRVEPFEALALELSFLWDEHS